MTKDEFLKEPVRFEKKQGVTTIMMPDCHVEGEVPEYKVFIRPARHLRRLIAEAKEKGYPVWVIDDLTMCRGLEVPYKGLEGPVIWLPKAEMPKVPKGE